MLDVVLPSGHSVEEKTITVEGVVQCGDDVCEGSETAGTCPADCALEPEETGRAGGADDRPTVPAAAGGKEGVGGTLWMTRGTVFNPGDEPTKVVFEYTPLKTTTVLEAGPFDLEPESSYSWDNLLNELFDATGSGALWLDSTEPVLFSTRTYNKTDIGNYGQSFFGIRESLTLGRGGGVMYLIGLREDDRFRSNFYLQEVDGLPVTVEVEIFNGSGERLKRTTISLDGHSAKLKNLGSLGVSGVASAYATVQVTEGDGRVAVAGSVIDHITGDPTSVDPFLGGQATVKVAGDSHNLVAAVAHSESRAFNSVWRSRLTLNNADNPTSQDVDLVYVVEYDKTGVVGDRLEETVTVPAGHQLSWDDVIVELFGLPERAKTQGSLHVYADQSVMVESSTYNERADSGTLGLKIPALKADDLIASGENGTMADLIHTAGTRTNIGLAEFSGQDTEVTLTFFKSRNGRASQYLDTLPAQTVPADSHLQITRVFEELGLDPAEEIEAWALVTVTGGGSVYAYATVIDNGTGDATIATTAKNID